MKSVVLVEDIFYRVGALSQDVFDDAINAFVSRQSVAEGGRFDGDSPVVAVGEVVPEEDVPQQGGVDHRDKEEKSHCVAVEVNEFAEPQLYTQPVTRNTEAPQ